MIGHSGALHTWPELIGGLLSLNTNTTVIGTTDVPGCLGGSHQLSPFGGGPAGGLYRPPPPPEAKARQAMTSLEDAKERGKGSRPLTPRTSMSHIWYHDQRCRTTFCWWLMWPKPPVFLSHFQPLCLASTGSVPGAISDFPRLAPLWGLSPRAGDLAVDSPCPPLLSKQERCQHSQPSVLCALCSRLPTSGWWGRCPVNTYPVGTRFGTPSALCTLSFACSPLADLCSVTQPSARPGLPLLDPSTAGGGGVLLSTPIRWGATLEHHLRLARFACAVPSFFASLAVTKVLDYLPSASDDKTCRPVDALLCGGSYASA